MSKSMKQIMCLVIIIFYFVLFNFRLIKELNIQNKTPPAAGDKKVPAARDKTLSTT